jgi:hypothetical protein
MKGRKRRHCVEVVCRQARIWESRLPNCHVRQVSTPVSRSRDLHRIWIEGYDFREALRKQGSEAPVT